VRSTAVAGVLAIAAGGCAPGPTVEPGRRLVARRDRVDVIVTPGAVRILCARLGAGATARTNGSTPDLPCAVPGRLVIACGNGGAACVGDEERYVRNGDVHR
jgi:hypothetical protein